MYTILVTDWVPEIKFLGTRNQPKMGLRKVEQGSSSFFRIFDHEFSGS